MTDEFDDLLRSRLQRSQPRGSGDAHNVLGQLKPAMRRARIRHGVAVGAATLSVLGVSGLGLAAVTTSLNQQPSELDIMNGGEPIPKTASQTSTTVPNSDETAQDLLVAEPTNTHTVTSSLPTMTVVLSDSTTTTVAPPSPASPATIPDTPTGNPATPGTTAPLDPTVSASTAPPTPSTTAPATPTVPLVPETTAPPPTTQPARATQQTIQSNCGSITVSHDANSVTLVSTQPSPGFFADIKNAGSEQVEVGFENGDAECEIKAWVDSGELRTDVDNHEEEDPDEDDEAD